MEDQSAHLHVQRPIVFEIYSKTLGQGKDELAVGYLEQKLLTQVFTRKQGALLAARGVLMRRGIWVFYGYSMDECFTLLHQVFVYHICLRLLLSDKNHLHVFLLPLTSDREVRGTLRL
jgi:hypothetical protein